MGTVAGKKMTMMMTKVNHQHHSRPACFSLGHACFFREYRVRDSFFRAPPFRRILSTSLSLRSALSLSDKELGLAAGGDFGPWLRSSKSVLVGEIDSCLSVVAEKIPPRLAIPSFLEAAPSLLSYGHSGAARFATLLGEVWSLLDRTAILSSMNHNGTLCAYLLDYRRVHGRNGEDPGSVQVERTVVTLWWLC